MRTKKLAIPVMIGALFLSSCTLMKNNETNLADGGSMSARGRVVSPEVLIKYTAGWSDTSVQAAKALLTKYGQPTESTPSMLVWRSVSPFKRISVYREEVTHKFPMLHKDVVEHVVSYKVPIDKVEALAKFDGSVFFDRTRGELTSRSSDEATNILVLNLANDIVKGSRTSESARTELGRVAVDILNGNKAPLSENLQFVAQSNAADPDQSTKFNWSAQAQEEKPAPRNQQRKNRLLRQSQQEIAE